jgi:glycosyltransferase involved in cell wall biosynthesis
MSPLRIAFIAEFYHPLVGGAEHSADALLQALARRGHQVTAFRAGKEQPYHHQGVEVVPVLDLPPIQARLAELAPHLILTQSHWAPAAVELAHALGVQAWFYVHALDHFCPSPIEMAQCDRDCASCKVYQPHAAAMERQKEAVRRADRVLVPSRYAAGEVARFTGRTDAVVVPPPIAPVEAAGQVPRPFWTMSTVAEFKGLSTFLAVAEHFPSQRFLLVGRGTPKAAGVDLRRHPNVEFRGVVEPADFLSVTEFLLVPSILPETFGRVVPEAQLAGVLPLVSQFGGLPEAMGEGGVAVSPHRDARAWIAALEALRADPGRVKGLLERGQAHAQGFLAETVTERFTALVEAFAGGAEGLPVRWEGTLFRYHSLAHVNRQLGLALHRLGGVDLGFIPYEVDDFPAWEYAAYSPLAERVRKPLEAAVHVRHQWPPRFDPPPAGAWVMIQPWEFGGLPASWIPPMSDLVDEVWVPSPWVREAYIASGLPADQVQVVPNGIDPERFQPEGLRFELPTRKRFRFLFLGGLIHRKGLDVLLRSFASAFTSADDVALVVKGQGGGVYGDEGLQAAVESLRSRPGAAEILLMGDSLDEAALASLYRACDVFVAPYRGEGFGLPILEAMACGLPVIVTAAGASGFFADDECAWRIPSAKVPIPRVDTLEPGPAGFWLEEPDPEALSRALRRAFEGREETAEKGKAARQRALAFTWTRAAEIAKARLVALAGTTPRRFRPPARVALLHQTDWTTAEWAEVVLAYAGAFKPGEPVLLLLCQGGAEAGIPADQAQQAVLDLLDRAGFTVFPDISIPEDLADLAAQLQTCQAFHWVGRNVRAAVAPLGSALDRFSHARSRLRA